MKVRTTQLENYHKQLGAVFTIFAGFRLPLYYTSISSEHIVVRERVGIFDVSHMGRIKIWGSESKRFLNYVTANDINKLCDGKMQYSLILNEKGGIKDDITVYRESVNDYYIVVNAANRDKIMGWLMKNKAGFKDVYFEDITFKTSMFAVQGPESPKVYKEIFGEDFDIRRFHFTRNDNMIISRSGYTGEDGFEVILFEDDRKNISKLFSTLLKAVKKYDGLPCGLGARDTLRIEAGYCLYGNDIDEDITPFEASLDWVVKFDKGNFIGKRSLLRKTKPFRKRVGLIMIEKGIPRKGYKIYVNESERGWVSSGGFSPLLNTGMGMIYLDIEYLEDGREVFVDVRGRLNKGLVRSFPLYDKNKYGFMRRN